MAHQFYQIFLLGPEKLRFTDQIRSGLTKLFSDIGLNFESDAQLLVGGEIFPDWKGLPVAIWFGGVDQIDDLDLQLMKEFLNRGFSLFPVVEDLLQYQKLVPEELTPINGQLWVESRVCSDLMKALRLSRPHRQAFISYKRSESSGLAHQLFHELNERGFRVFLDTASIEAGIHFQNALWSRMADVDLLILIDTPEAFTSRWVHEELSRAQNLGMGVVQLVWPGHSQTKGTEFSSTISLEEDHFIDKRVDSNSTLTSAIIERISATIEDARIRSVNSRRIRLVESLLEHTSNGAIVYIHPAQNIDILKGDTKIAEVIPFVGVPDSLSIFQEENRISFKPTIIVFNGLGVDEEWSKHLIWLTASTGAIVRQIEDFGTYWKELN